MNNYTYYNTCVSSNSAQYYRCSFHKKRMWKCPATMAIRNNGEIKFGKKDHNHNPQTDQEISKYFRQFVYYIYIYEINENVFEARKTNLYNTLLKAL